MYGCIFGFHLWVRWPKCAPDSSNWRMENSGKAIIQSPSPVSQTRGLSLDRSFRRTPTLPGTPDGDEETPFETHPRVRVGGAYTDLARRAQAAMTASPFQSMGWSWRTELPCAS